MGTLTAPGAGATDATTLANLRALLGVAALVRSHEDLEQLLERAAGTVCAAVGFGVVVVNLQRPAWDDFEVAVIAGARAEDREVLLGEHVPNEVLAQLLDERFRRHDAYFIRHDQLDFDSLGVAWMPGQGRGDGDE